jgi:hypothetical protein
MLSVVVFLLLTVEPFHVLGELEQLKEMQASLVYR